MSDVEDVFYVNVMGSLENGSRNLLFPKWNILFSDNLYSAKREATLKFRDTVKRNDLIVISDSPAIIMFETSTWIKCIGMKFTKWIKIS